jgi:hypothetical protein
VIFSLSVIAASFRWRESGGLAFLYIRIYNQ